MIKNRVMMHALMVGVMAYSMASKKDGDTNGQADASDPAAPVDSVVSSAPVDPVVSVETAAAVAVDPADGVAVAADPVLTDSAFDPAVQEVNTESKSAELHPAVTEINESNLPPDPEPHPVGSVLDEIESAVSNFAHELGEGFKSVIDDLIKKAKDLL